MNKKLLTIVAILLISLTSMSMGAASFTTADGDGADGGISNDDNAQDTVVGGTATSAAIRHYDGTRARAMVLRFDLAGGVGGDLSGTTLSVTETTGNRARTMSIYGLVDETDELSWEESELCYNTTPGLTDPDNDGYITMDETVWEEVGTMDFEAVSSAEVISGEVDPNFLRADTNGTVTFMLYTSGSDSSHYYYTATKENTDGYAYPTLSFPNARYASAPTPDNGSTVTTDISELSWTSAEPNDVSGIITCDVYFGTEPNRLGDMNMTTITTAGVNSVAINTSNFPDYGDIAVGTYYWFVDSYDSSSTPTSLGYGATWSFEVTAVPVIDSEPVDQVVSVGDSAQFSIGVASDSDVTYTWYVSDDDTIDTGDSEFVSGTEYDVVSFASTSGSDEGYYYCKAVNESGEESAVYSSVVRLVVERQVAHYTLDGLVGGQFEDISGEGHNADPNDSTGVTFEDGVAVAVTNQGAVIDQYSAATAGTWDPAYVSGEFSVALWVKRTADTGSFLDLVTKHNGWDASTTLWQFGVNSSNALQLIRAGGSSVYGATLPIDTWVYVALVFDGSTAYIYSFEVGSEDVNFSIGSGSYTLGDMTDANFNIGCWYDSGTPTEIFPGVLDEIQVFNYALDAIEIADLYNEAVSQDFCLREFGQTEGGIDLDINGNCVIEVGDFAALAADWLICGLYPNCE